MEKLSLLNFIRKHVICFVLLLNSVLLNQGQGFGNDTVIWLPPAFIGDGAANSSIEIVPRRSVEIGKPKPVIPKAILSPTALKPGPTYYFNSSETNRYLWQDVTDYVCGSAGLCNKSLSNWEKMCSFECLPCQCDDSCRFYGDCCTDKAFEDSPNLPSQSNPYLICSLDEWTKWVNSTNIFMIGRCPPDAALSVVSKCEDPDIGDQVEATPVSDVASNITYRNKFCAECHSVFSYELWEHDATCSLASSVQDATSKSHLWRIVVTDEHCDVVSRPPEDVPIRDCYPTKYEKCNGTGKVSENIDPRIAELCAMYSHPVHYYGTTTVYVPYRNIFCAVCNGASLTRGEFCVRVAPGGIPFPLNILLNFNSSPEKTFETTDCDVGKIYDPFLKSCRNITCPLRKYLVGNDCEDIFPSARGLGLQYAVAMRRADSESFSTKNLLTAYHKALNASLQPFDPFIIAAAEMTLYGSFQDRMTPNSARLVTFRAGIISLTQLGLPELEITLLNISKANFTYESEDSVTVTLDSEPIWCGSDANVVEQTESLMGIQAMIPTPLGELEADCDASAKCEESIRYEPIQLQCPFIEFHLSLVNFTFVKENGTIFFENKTISLSPSTYTNCGDILKICVEEVHQIAEYLKQRNQSEDDFILSIISLVCLVLSLIGLVLTFLVYSIIPKLRTLPGKNMMSLIVNLFLAQLFFLTSSRASDVVVCQVLGVVIHYFWLSSFTWMSISAYHMFTVFTKLRPSRGVQNQGVSHYIRYCLFGQLVPLSIVSLCLVVFLVLTSGKDPGYGGRACFLNTREGIGGFFAGPLVLMIVVNVLFFAKSVRAISSVPDMTTASNQTNQHHVSVYIKLSVLFGFTWTFGILAEILQSAILDYIFIISTGSQGVMLFIAYCLNKRTISLLKDKLKPNKKEMPSTSTSNPSSSSYAITQESYLSKEK